MTVLNVAVARWLAQDSKGGGHGLAEIVSETLHALRCLAADLPTQEQSELPAPP